MQNNIIFIMMESLNNLLWGAPMLATITATGVYLSMRTRFFQLRRLGFSLKTVLCRQQGEKNTQSGISPFEAVCTALSATIGTGNIAGVAGAVALGGPGAVFWMWVSALFGMIIKFAETVLALLYREKKGEEYVGGPMYYIKNALPRRFLPLAFLFAGFGAIASFGTGNAVQVNTMAAAVRVVVSRSSELSPDAAFGVNLAVGMVTALLVGTVLLGGVSRIGKATGKLVPFMAVVYLVMSFGVIFLNAEKIPGVFYSIFRGAFNPSAVTGGVIGSFFLTLTKGMSRGIFSNEAGMGTSAMAHACAKTDSPIRQGMYGIFEVFVDTVVICTLTAVVILCSGAVDYGVDTGTLLTLNSFAGTYGKAANLLLGAEICFFAFSSVIGWGFYGIRCISFLFGKGAARPFLYCFSFVCVLGAVSGMRIVWDASELANGLMALPNLVAVLLLSPRVAKCVREYETGLKDDGNCVTIKKNKLPRKAA